MTPKDGAKFYAVQNGKEAAPVRPKHAKPSGLNLAPVLRTAAFLLVLLLAFHVVSGLLRNKNYASASASIYAEPKNSLDVLLMGSSHMLNAVAPMQLWEDFGIASNNLAQNGQVLPVTYYHLQEALRYQKPKLVVLDIYKAIQDSLIDSNASLHYTLDNMTFGLPKLRAVFDLLPPEERMEFLLPIITYHSRWKDLDQLDFQSADCTEKGAQALFGTTPLPDFQILPETCTAAPAESALVYLEKIIALCRQEGVELLLVAVPFATPEDDDMSRQEVVNGMAAYAGKWGVPFVNMMHCTEEMAFDYETDMADVFHANWLGMEKITAWLGEYLVTHYDLPDRRTDGAYAAWSENLPAYHALLMGQGA